MVNTCLMLLEAHTNPFYSNAGVEVTSHFSLPSKKNIPWTHINLCHLLAIIQTSWSL
jgi:hypothetical protein